MTPDLTEKLTRITLAVRPADLNATCDCGFYYGKHSGDCAAAASSPADRDGGGEPKCKECDGMGWINLPDGESRQCDCIFVDPPSTSQSRPTICHECGRVGKHCFDCTSAPLYDLGLSVEEISTIEDLKASKELSALQVIRQALRTYQRGVATPPPVAPVACHDYCKLAKSTGVTCAPDECDLAIGIRSAPVAREETATPETCEFCGWYTHACKCDSVLLGRLHAAEAERDQFKRDRDYVISVKDRVTAEMDTARAEVARLTERAIQQYETDTAEMVRGNEINAELRAALSTATARTEELEKALKEIRRTTKGSMSLLHIASVADCALLATRPATGSGETTGE